VPYWVICEGLQRAIANVEWVVQGAKYCREELAQSGQISKWDPRKAEIFSACLQRQESLWELARHKPQVKNAFAEAHDCLKDLACGYVYYRLALSNPSIPPFSLQHSLTCSLDRTSRPIGNLNGTVLLTARSFTFH
jgi:hypothetical protein